MAAGMFGLDQALGRKPKEEAPIVMAAADEPVDIDRLGEPFFRPELARTRESGGVGLGLTIARDGARSHGGDVRLSNRHDGGLSARIELPV